jgi:hypothetical protein
MRWFIEEFMLDCRDLVLYLGAVLRAAIPVLIGVYTAIAAFGIAVGSLLFLLGAF